MNCRKCKNHGILSLLRGHKNKCRFNECSCVHCKSTRILNINQRRVTRQRRCTRRGETQLDGNECNGAESKEDPLVIAWLNGEEIDDESGG